MWLFSATKCFQTGLDCVSLWFCRNIVDSHSQVVKWNCQWRGRQRAIWLFFVYFNLWFFSIMKQLVDKMDRPMLAFHQNSGHFLWSECLWWRPAVLYIPEGNEGNEDKVNLLGQQGFSFPSSANKQLRASWNVHSFWWPLCLDATFADTDTCEMWSQDCETLSYNSSFPPEEVIAGIAKLAHLLSPEDVNPPTACSTDKTDLAAGGG